MPPTEEVRMRLRTRREVRFHGEHERKAPTFTLVAELELEAGEGDEVWRWHQENTPLVIGVVGAPVTIQRFVEERTIVLECSSPGEVDDAEEKLEFGLERVADHIRSARAFGHGT